MGLIFQVPKIHWDLTTKRLLAMEFCEGGRIDDLEFIEKCGIRKAEVRNLSHFYRPIRLSLIVADALISFVLSLLCCVFYRSLQGRLVVYIVKWYLSRVSFTVTLILVISLCRKAKMARQRLLCLIMDSIRYVEIFIWSPLKGFDLLPFPTMVMKYNRWHIGRMLFRSWKDDHWLLAKV